MSSRDDDIDPRVRSLYGRSSTAEPPAVLDDAIRAAAHRAVGSAPHAHPGTMRRTPGAARAWWSWAAAATVGAIAIGIVEMMPTDERTQSAVAPSPPSQVIHEDTSLPKAGSDTATAPAADAQRDSLAPASPNTVAPASPNTVAPASPKPLRKSEAARAVVRPPVSAPAAPAPAAAMPVREAESRPEAVERAPSAGSAASLDTSAGANANSGTAPKAFPAPPPASSPAPSPPFDAATPSRGTQQMAKSRGALAERASVASFDERVKAIQTLVHERRYEEARRELVRLRDDHPDRIDTIPPELRALLPPR